ncbi:MFS transporter [Burkholderia multivorans]|jgi:predicted MFS family arabinose efflux permease|uniref:MFS transporter n=2 Tax=Burkholderia multivorans TaxID=87883 RepID=A0A8E2RR08_9BURK|nr:MFS transporter [Burkholderia multivorans]MBU9428602.1 MFS transporter [Burkholderia multivorans]MCA8260968.1 MFS transporter [Burkholderia multivorans]MCL4626823.1 MFS transporter [Burkholderia multivorans]MCO1357472.1 MFS transporter [Burkholderia multivorans]MCO1391686.1 MFS transporter [Burkholderia multivorans]
MSTPHRLDAAPHARPAAHAAASSLPGRRLVLLLAAAAGLGVAPLYYAQPMLGALGTDLGASARAIGFVPTLTQLGYALGILLLAPLGDRFDRRRVIVAKAAALVVALLLAAVAPSLGLLLAASFAIGLTATMAQDVVPAAATLAHDQHRGRIVGTVMTGLLLGILLSRVVAGFVAETAGWRAMFALAAASVAAIGIVAARGLPRFAPTTQLPYRALIGSLRELWQRHRALRRAALAQGLLAIGFSAFWSTLAIMLHDAPFHLGSAAAGAFGLAGAAGALAAPIAGRLADRHGPEHVTRIGIGIATLSFAAMAAAPAMPAHAQLALLAAATIGFDLGVQATLIAHQAIVYRIDPASRSRLNAVLFVGMFIGMAAGAALGGLLLAQLGWNAVIGLAVASSLAALAVRMWRQ